MGTYIFSSFFENHCKKSVDRVLVFRSGRMWQVRILTESLRIKLPDADVDILCQKSAIEDCRSLEGIRSVLAYPGEKFIFSKTPPSLIFSLRRQRYDLIVIVLNNLSGIGYESVIRIAKCIGGRKLTMYRPHDDIWIIIPALSISPQAAILAAPLVALCAGLLAIFHAPLSISSRILKAIPRKSGSRKTV